MNNGDEEEFYDAHDTDFDSVKNSTPCTTGTMPSNENKSIDEFLLSNKDESENVKPLSDRLNKMKIENLEEEDTVYAIDEESIRKQNEKLSEEELKELEEKAVRAKSDGNRLFCQKLYSEALDTYTEALRTCPLRESELRSVLHSNRAACFQHLGDNEKAIAECTRAIGFDEQYEKPLLRRAKLYEATEMLDEALADYKKVLCLNSSCNEAQKAIAYLPQKIKIRNEKLKEEMFTKLKDLGNLVLKPFGLSTDNFKVEQNPDTGSYSISMQK